MKDNPTVSIAMATYNGEKYISEQLESILLQLSENDEIVISDDGSTDNTLNLINRINDKRVTVVSGPKKGYKKNFENALKYCNNDIIFLCDQDDIWFRDKINIVKRIMVEQEVNCVVHDSLIINYDVNHVINKSFFSVRNAKKGFIHNLIRGGYYGCMMAIDHESLSYILPIPESVYDHDLWIGLMCEIYGKTYFYRHPLMYYRRHGDNVSGTKHFTLRKMIHKRWCLIKEICIRVMT